MKTIEGTVQSNNPKLYERCQLFPGGYYRGVQRFDSMTPNYLYSMIHDLEFRSNDSYMLHEVLELIQAESKEAPLRTDLEPLLALYLNSTGFQKGIYTLAELIDILAGSEDWPASYDLGYAPTDPIITDFIKSLSLQYSREQIYQIKDSLASQAHNVIRTLQKGIPCDLMASMLLDKCNSWVFDIYPLILESPIVGEVFLDLSCYHDGPISVEMVSRLAHHKDLLEKLAIVSDAKIAAWKLLLMIYFPESVQLIFNLPPVIASRAIAKDKLTEWRAVANRNFRWGIDQRISDTLIDYNFNFTKNYYDEYKANLMFDDLFIALLEEKLLREYEGTIVTQDKRQRQKQLLKNFSSSDLIAKIFRDYRRDIITREPQGTVYSIIKDRYNKLEWGAINPLSNEINPEFEDECVDILALKYSPSTLWFSSRYVDIMSGTSTPISRLTFHSKYFLDDFVFDHCMDDHETSLVAIYTISEVLANYCQTREEYPKEWESYARNYEVSSLFSKIWEHNIAHCDFMKSLGIIAASLENNQIDLLTRRLLLYILKSVVETHYSARVASRMDFTTWTDGLKEQLFIIFGKLHELGNCEDEGLNGRSRSS